MRILVSFLFFLSCVFVQPAGTTPPAAKDTSENSDDSDEVEPAQLKGAKALREADEAVRIQMMVISRQLGVTCTTCHTNKSFAANEKREYQIAKEHMKMTQILIDHGFDGREKRPKADCFMCHRGKLHPDYIEVFDPMTMDKKK